MIESSKVQYILIFTSSSFVISNIMTLALVFGGLTGVPWIIRISTSSPLLHNDSTLPTRLVSFRSSRNSCRINGILSTLSSLVFFKKIKFKGCLWLPEVEHVHEPIDQIFSLWFCTCITCVTIACSNFFSTVCFV